jgi:hypothetical protein
MIEASQRMITMNCQGELGGMSPSLERHLELQIERLETAPRDTEKLERILTVLLLPPCPLCIGKNLALFLF